MTLFLLACTSQQSVTKIKKEAVDPAAPPDDEADLWGRPPDWNDCYEGFRGLYFNLENTHPDVEPDIDDPVVANADNLDWWDFDRLYNDQFDPAIDFGTNWWPVDDGLVDDPAYFATRWIAWIRVWDDGPFTFSLGAADDAWVLYDDDFEDSATDTLASQPGISDYNPQEYTVDLEAGQAHFDVRYAHRSTNVNGFRFRVIEGDATICYPDYEPEEEDTE